MRKITELVSSPSWSQTGFPCPVCCQDPTVPAFRVWLGHGPQEQQIFPDCPHWPRASLCHSLCVHCSFPTGSWMLEVTRLIVPTFPSPKVPTHHQTMGVPTQVEFPPSGSRQWKGPGSGGSVSPAGTGDRRTASKDSQASQSTLTIYFSAVSLRPALTLCPSSLEPGHLSWLLLRSCLIAAETPPRSLP